MSAWRRTALALLPDCKRAVEAAESPMGLWCELSGRLHCEYEFEAPRRGSLDDDLVSRIYRLADIAYEAKDDDVFTAVVVGFYEDLPTNARVAADLPRWMTNERFRELGSAFRYHLNDDEFDAFRARFLDGRTRRLAELP